MGKKTMNAVSDASAPGYQLCPCFLIHWLIISQREFVDIEPELHGTRTQLMNIYILVII
jgi:hypothetical protein